MDEYSRCTFDMLLVVYKMYKKNSSYSKSSTMFIEVTKTE